MFPGGSLVDPVEERVVARIGGRPTNVAEHIVSAALTVAVAVLQGRLLGSLSTPTVPIQVGPGVTLLEGGSATGLRTMLVDTMTGRIIVGGSKQALHAQVFEAAGLQRYVGVVGAMGRFEAGRLAGFELATGTFGGTALELQQAKVLLRALGAAR